MELLGPSMESNCECMKLPRPSMELHCECMKLLGRNMLFGMDWGLLVMELELLGVGDRLLAMQ